MMNNSIRNISITQLTSLALLAILLAQAPIPIARAATATAIAFPQSTTRDGVVILWQSLPGGLVRGERQRFTIFNPNRPDRGGEPGEPFNCQVKLFDEQGNVIATSAESEIPAATFRSFDFDRGEISQAGEPGTGRLQFRATVRFTVFSARKLPEEVPVSIETMDALTGSTLGGSEAKANLKALYTAEKAY